MRRKKRLAQLMWRMWGAKTAAMAACPASSVVGASLEPAMMTMVFLFLIHRHCDVI
jgi:hypothetical protein